jgi:DNA-binding transcriptional ArsR family regulator
MDSTNLVQEITQLHAELCSALAESTRLFILYALAERPCNVTELTQKLELPQPTISRHLKVLREAGLVHSTRQGMVIHYALTDKRVIEALDILRSVLRDRIQHHADLMDEFILS